MLFALLAVLFEKAWKGTIRSDESSSWMRESFSRVRFRFAELQVHSSIASKVADAKAMADFRTGPDHQKVVRTVTVRSEGSWKLHQAQLCSEADRCVDLIQDAASLFHHGNALKVITLGTAYSYSSYFELKRRWVVGSHPGIFHRIIDIYRFAYKLLISFVGSKVVLCYSAPGSSSTNF